MSEYLKCLGENFPKRTHTLLPNTVPTENLIFGETRVVLREINVDRNAESTAVDRLENFKLLF